MKTVTTSTFATEVEASSTPVLVKFWADWCQPCKMLAPTIEKLATFYGSKVKFVQINAEDESVLTAQLHINALPTLLVYKDGKLSQSLVGLQSEKNIKAALDNLV